MSCNSLKWNKFTSLLTAEDVCSLWAELYYILYSSIHSYYFNFGYFIDSTGGVIAYVKDQRENWINWNKDNYQIIYNLYVIILQLINPKSFTPFYILVLFPAHHATPSHLGV